MFLDPRGLFMLVVLVGVTGFVVKNVLLALHRIRAGDQAQRGDRLAAMEERLGKIEGATSSLLVDVSGIKEKQRFMARLQSGAPPRETEGDLSPMVTQAIPIVPRIGSPRT